MWRESIKPTHKTAEIYIKKQVNLPSGGRKRYAFGDMQLEWETGINEGAKKKKVL